MRHLFISLPTHRTKLILERQNQLTTVDMSLAIQALITEGYPVNHRLVAALSPFGTRNIKRYGDYVVNLHNIPQPLDLAINLPPEIFKT